MMFTYYMLMNQDTYTTSSEKFYYDPYRDASPKERKHLDAVRRRVNIQGPKKGRW